MDFVVGEEAEVIEEAVEDLAEEVVVVEADVEVAVVVLEPEEEVRISNKKFRFKI